MDAETLKWLASLGIGGVLAGMMFFVYRKDMKQNAEDWRGQTELLVAIVKENTQAITALIALVQRIQS